MRGPTPTPGRDRPPAEPMRSQFADDPEMIELIQFFLGELDQKVQSIEAAFSSGRSTELRVLAHQLSGAAGGYGFPEIGRCANDLEQALKAGEAEVSALTERVESLITMCRRASRTREAA